MKTRSFSRLSRLTAFLSLFLFLTFACDKEDTAPIANEEELPCLLLKQEQSIRDYNYDVTVAYDAQGRISSTTEVRADGTKHTSKYERNSAGKINKIVRTVGEQVMGQVVVEYGPQGKWVKFNIADVSNVVNLIEFEHDSQGIIIRSKTSTTFEGRDPYITHKTYEYTDGNLSRMTRTDENVTKITEYEYYLDKPASDFEYDRMFDIYNEEASPSKNLVKRTSTTRATSDYRSIDNYVYEFNEAGFSTQMTKTNLYNYNGTAESHNGDTLIITRSYSCD